MEGLKVSDTNLKVFLHPSKSGDVDGAIHHELSSMIFKFDDTLDGVLVAYKFNISSKNAKILSGVHPYFTVSLRATLLLFSPKPNMLVEGKVVKLTRGSISVIVLGFSCAFIKDEDIHEEFNYKNISEASYNKSWNHDTTFSQQYGCGNTAHIWFFASSSHREHSLFR